MNLFAITSLLSVITNLFLIIFTFFQEKKQIQRVFICFTTSVAIWSYGCFVAAKSTTPEQALVAWKLTFFVGFFVGTFYYHIIHIFTENKNRFVLYFSYTQSVIFDLLLVIFPKKMFSGTRDLFGIHYVDAGPILQIAVIIYLVIVSISFVELIQYFKSPIGRQKRQTTFIFFGFFFGFAGTVPLFLPIFNIDAIYPFGNIWICVSDLILFYAIIRYRIMDIRTVIQRTIVYLVLASVISSVYVAAVFFFRTLFIGETISGAQVLSNLLFIVVIALMIKPAELLLHRVLDKLFFKGTISEISEQKEKLESELERSERLKSVGILAAGMAHEIKNPLTAINAFAEHLPIKYDDPEFREKFSRIVRDEVKRIKDIVSNLLMFSKPSEPVQRPTDVSAVLKDLLDLLSSDMLKENIRVNLKLQNCPKAFVDPDQLKQALLNILINALDSMRGSGGELAIGITSGHDITVAIQDTGCGIPKDKAKHIFDPFFTDKEHGTGLGLAVTHSIIQKNKGSIQVESELGKGTLFTIKIPASK